MEDEGIRDIRSCIRVPGIYIVPWYSVTSGKTEIDSGSVALRKRWRILSGREFTYSIAHFDRLYEVGFSQKSALAKDSHYVDYTDFCILGFASLLRVHDLSRNPKWLVAADNIKSKLCLIM